jgi:hypothetical protein
VTIVLQSVLALFTFGLSLLVFLMVRQVGILSRRLPPTPDRKPSQKMVPGAVSPVREFETYDGKTKLRIPLVEDRPTYLLFASFTCSLCRPLLEELRRMARDLRPRIVLMMLDQRVSQRFSGEIAEWSLESWTIVESLHWSGKFEISATPAVFAFDAEGRLMETEAVYSLEDLEEFIRRQDRGPARSAEPAEEAVASAPPPPPLNN